MKAAQILVVENDGRLTAQLEALATETLKCPLRHPRDVGECLELLALGGPAVVIVRLGTKFEDEMRLLAETTRRHPDVAAVVVGDAVHAPLTGLAWELGASYVLIQPQPREMLPEIVAGLLRQDNP